MSEKDKFWDSFWEKAEGLVKCCDCPYFKKCHNGRMIPNQFCGHFLKARFEEYLKGDNK